MLVLREPEKKIIIIITKIIIRESQNREGSFQTFYFLICFFVWCCCFFVLFICLLFILPFLFRSLWESDVLSVFRSTHFCLFRFCVGVMCARLIVLLLLLLLKISRNILKPRTEVWFWDKFYWPNLLPALHKMLEHSQVLYTKSCTGNQFLFCKKMVAKFQPRKEWVNKVNLSSFEPNNVFFKFVLVWLERENQNILTSQPCLHACSNANTPLSQSERAQYLIV